MRISSVSTPRPKSSRVMSAILLASPRGEESKAFLRLSRSFTYLSFKFSSLSEIEACVSARGLDLIRIVGEKIDLIFWFFWA